jgi:crotonyl-CoA carboxylase/reductase
VWDVLGEKTNPRIVFEHPGQDTIPTSIFACDRGGMVVICAGTTGYDTVVDVRYLWYLQKRYQGSHLFNDEQATAFNDLVREGKIRTTLGHTYRYEEAGEAHQLMGDGRLPEGNVAVLINAPEPGLRDLPG